jgi:bZIP transcription factor
MLNTHVMMSNDQEAEAANPAPSNDAASARKRRKLIIQSQRSEAEHPASDGNAAGSSDGASDSSVKSEREQPSKTSRQGDDAKSSDSKQNRTQVKYNPDIPMSKEQLAAWRREARRVRNRESAAASRQRIRSRISELEDEVSDPTANCYMSARNVCKICQTNCYACFCLLQVGEWKLKYASAMERLRVLEQKPTSKSTDQAKI